MNICRYFMRNLMTQRKKLKNEEKNTKLKIRVIR